MPCYCPSCHCKVNNGQASIACDFCDKFYHLECTGLTQNQFDIYSIDESFSWNCNKCDVKRCNKCNILTRHNHPIQCDKCDKFYHLRCAGLSKTAYIPTTSWFCYQCNEDIFPFNSISVKQISTLTFNSIETNKHPNKLRTLHISLPHTQEVKYFNNKCSVCHKTVAQTKAAIPCPSCKHLIHKKCSKLKPSEISQLKESRNCWECITCSIDKFPFSESDDVELHLDAFNSNWSCNCKTHTQPFQLSPESCKSKLILTRKKR